MHFRWGVALVGEISTRHCSPRRGTTFPVQGVYRETALRRGCDGEGGRHVALSNIFVKVFCIKGFLLNSFGLLYKWPGM